MSQLQFLATLSLVASVREAPSMFAAFVQSLRYIHVRMEIPVCLGLNDDYRFGDLVLSSGGLHAHLLTRAVQEQMCLPY